MSVLRNRFLSTSSLLFAPPDPPAGGKKPVADVVESVDVEQGTGGEGEAGETGAEGGDGDDGGAEGDDGGGAEGGEDADEDEDPDLAELPPEVRAKAKAAIEKRVARETGWRDRQIDRLHAKRRSAEEDVQAVGTIVSRQPGAAAAPENLTEAEIDRRATERARSMTAQQQYDDNSNDADQRGKAAYGDKWGTAIGKIPKLGGVDVPDMVDILATDQPHVVLFQLSDPETYERVMALPPARRRNEYVKLAMKEAPKPRATNTSKRPSEATPPVTPLQGGRRVAAQQVNLADDKVDDDAWYAARNATRRKKFSDHA